VHPVGEAVEHARPLAQGVDDAGSDGHVVLREVELGLAAGREVRTVGVADAYVVAVDVEDDGLPVLSFARGHVTQAIACGRGGGRASARGWRRGGRGRMRWSPRRGVPERSYCQVLVRGGVLGAYQNVPIVRFLTAVACWVRTRTFLLSGSGTPLGKLARGRGLRFGRGLGVA